MSKGVANQKTKNFRREEWKPPSKAGRIFIKNLSFDITEDMLESHFLKFGDIREVTLPRRKDGKLLGCGFVQFTRREAAEKAIEECSGKELMGREITVAFALPKPEFVGKSIVEGAKKGSTGRKSAIGENEFKEESDNENTHWKSKDAVDIKIEKEKYFERQKKRARIIVRNVSFAATEDKLTEHFKEFGTIIDIKLLRKPDGSMVGCAFLEYKKKQEAIKAILARSGKPFLGRPIICDWAVPKEKYPGKILNQDNAHQQSSIQNEDSGDVKIKEEPVSDESDDEHVKKEEPSSGSDQDIDEVKEEEDEEEDDGDEEDYGSVDEDEEEEKKPSLPLKKKRGFEDKEGNEKKRPRVISNDATEGCTVFMKNVPFSVTNEQLKECVEQIGPVHYALVCMDPLTEHSRGTAFTKFKNKEDADKCLEEGLVLQDSAIEVFRALPRDEIKQKSDLKREKKEKREKDKRHLYLVKEGVILAGSPAARGVSVSDMERRLKIEQMKTQMLRNLNMFISNTRLVVYNVPLNWTDHQIRELFKKHGGPGSELKEARIMRDVRNVDANGVGKSKEYAFVHFTRQENALRALRSINNNPDIFTPNKRPIVSFSIENKAIHKIKQKRMQKSKMNNPMFQDRKPQKTTPSGHSLKNRRNANQNPIQNSNEGLNQYPAEEEGNSYTGVTAVPGNKKFRSKFKLKTQNATHVQKVRAEKRRMKMKKRSLEHGKMKKREPLVKKRHVAETDSFNLLVNKYKSKLFNQESRKKWYE